MPPRAIKRQLTCPIEFTSGSSLIGRYSGHSQESPGWYEIPQNSPYPSYCATNLRYMHMWLEGFFDHRILPPFIILFFLLTDLTVDVEQNEEETPDSTNTKSVDSGPREDYSPPNKRIALRLMPFTESSQSSYGTSFNESDFSPASTLHYNNFKSINSRQNYYGHAFINNHQSPQPRFLQPKPRDLQMRVRQPSYDSVPVMPHVSSHKYDQIDYHEASSCRYYSPCRLMSPGSNPHGNYYPSLNGNSGMPNSDQYYRFWCSWSQRNRIIKRKNNSNFRYSGPNQEWICRQQ